MVINESGHKIGAAMNTTTAFACLAIGLVFVVSTAAAQHRHPPQDEALHEKFYSTWYMPDNPARSCCNNADCYPTDIKYVGGNIYARRREDGQYIRKCAAFAIGAQDDGQLFGRYSDAGNHYCFIRIDGGFRTLANGRRATVGPIEF